MDKTLINNIIEIKNGYQFNKKYINVKTCTFSESLFKILYLQGYILSYKFINQENAIVFLKDTQNYFIMKNIKIVSKPSQIKYLNYKQICRLDSKQKIGVVSTTKGIITLKNCKEYRTGGILLFLL